MTNTEKQIADLQAKITPIQEEINAIHSAEKLRENSQHVGKFFHYRNNASCPSKPEDYWWLYMHVLSLDENGHLYQFQFQDMSRHGQIIIEPKVFAILLLEGYQQITEKQFTQAYNKLLGKLEGLNA